MSQGGTSAEILFLRERIAAIEGRGVSGLGPLPRPGERARINFGEGCSLDRAFDGGLCRGALHEIVPGRPCDAVAASGFAAALAARFALDHDDFGSDRSISISMFRQIDSDGMNVIDSEGVERDRQTSPRNLPKLDCDGKSVSPFPRPAPKTGKARSIVWIVEDGTRREWGTPYGPGLRLHGLDPSRLVLVHTRDVRESLWSLEEAVKCRGVAAVIAEIWTLEQAYGLAASRRLVLAARESRTPALLVAPKLARDADRWSSAAATRFEVSSLRGAPVASAGQGLPLPGPAAWSIRIVKARAGPGRYGFDRERHLAVVWDHEKDCFRDAFSLALPALPRNRPDSVADARARIARIA